MKKEKLILVLLVILLPHVTATMFDTTIESYNSTLTQVSIEDTDNLYAYEVRLFYEGSSPSATNIALLSHCSPTTSGSHIDSATISLYETCLDSSRTGIDTSGYVANITHDAGDTLTFCSAAAVNANGTVEYEYSEECDPDTPDDPDLSPPGGGGGGGGGGFAAATPDYVFATPSFLNVNIRRTVSDQSESFVIQNNANVPLTMTITPQLIASYVHLDQDDITFTLEPGETKEITPTFFASQNAVLGSHTGWFEITSASEDGAITETDKVSVALSINPLEPLFDVYVELDETLVAPGDAVSAQVRLLNFGDLRDFDAIIYTAIKNPNNEVITFSETPVAIGYTYEGVFELPTSETTPVGQYVFVAEVTYQDTKATGSQGFTLTNQAPLFGPIDPNLLRNIGYAALIALTAGAFLFGIYKLVQKIRAIKRLRDEKMNDLISETIKGQFANNY